MTRFALQFGQTRPGLVYRERAAAYGVCADEEGRIALAQIGAGGPGRPVYDLPGGGLEAGEDEAAALVREFKEETGLTVAAGRLLGRAGQYWINQEEPRNSLSSFFLAAIAGPASAPTEPDHRLVWMPPAEALTALRHEAHAWAVTAWLRGRGQT